MTPKDLFLHCFAVRKEGVWIAHCLDFDLAVQGDSFEDVRKRLEAQINEYVYDALAGQDAKHAYALLRRRAPLSLWLSYYLLRVEIKFHLAKSEVSRLICEHMPLAPAHKLHA